MDENKGGYTAYGLVYDPYNNAFYNNFRILKTVFNHQKMALISGLTHLQC